jgi:hypothetical protein
VPRPTVTADDVVRITKKYLIGSPALWMVLRDFAPWPA